MTIVVSNKSRIHFRYEGERGAFLILHHGLFGSLDDWYESGYVEALAKDFRLIVIDARGHGRSDRHLDAGEYRLGQFAEDIVAVLDWLDIRNSHFVGYSLGALVGFDLLYRFPERVRIVLIGGEAPFVTEAAREEWREAAGGIRDESFSRWVARRRQEERLVRHVEPEDEAEQDAALSLLQAMVEWEPPQAESLPVRSPIALFSGATDPAAERIARAAKRIPRARHSTFGGMNHRDAFEDGTALLKAIEGFIRAPRRNQDDRQAGRDQQGGGREGRDERDHRAPDNRAGGETTADAADRREGAAEAPPVSPGDPPTVSGGSPLPEEATRESRSDSVENGAEAAGRESGSRNGEISDEAENPPRDDSWGRDGSRDEGGSETASDAAGDGAGRTGLADGDSD